METRLRIQLICMSLLICTLSLPVEAQIRSRAGDGFLKGLEGGFGIHSATIKSDIGELNDVNWVAEGGKILFVSGNRTIMTKGGLGFYYSASNVPQTIDLFYGELGFNFYPLSLLSPASVRINPYIVGGAFYNLYKFGGTYLPGNSEPRNFSTIDDTYLAKIKQINAHLGAGIEYRLIDEKEFLHVFVEGSWAAPLLANSTVTAFEQTSTARYFQTHIGVRFGLIKNR